MQINQTGLPNSENSSRVVLVGGCFDFIHYGHVRFLTEAKSFGDELVVALESDENVRRMKGPSRPIHTQKQRAAMLKALRVVDRIILLPQMTTDEEYANLVKNVRPSVIAVTSGDPMLGKKRAHAKEFGAGIVIIPKVHAPSTSQLSKLLELE